MTKLTAIASKNSASQGEAKPRSQRSNYKIAFKLDQRDVYMRQCQGILHSGEYLLIPTIECGIINNIKL